MACFSEVFFLIILQVFKICCKEIVVNKFENQTVCIDVNKNTKIETNTIYRNKSPVLSWGRKTVILAEGYENRINSSIHSINELTFCLINTTRDDTGTYYWKDSNGRKHAILLLTVWFGPTQLLLSPNVKTTNTVNESSILEINCTADCNPDCNIYWEKDQEIPFFLNSTTLRLENISKTDRGNYTCTAKNVQDNNHNISTKFELYVNYAPKITFKNFRNENENSTMNITCSVDSYPMSNISLFKDNRALTSSNKENEVLLNFHNTTCDDTGTYECSAYNGFGKTDSKKIHLEILCKPRFIGIETGYAIVKNMKASVGDEIILSVIVQAHPPPDVKLVLHDVNVTITKLSRTLSQVHIVKPISSVSDFRLYSVIIGNKEGIITVVFYVESNSSHRKVSAIDLKYFLGTSLSFVTFPIILFLIYCVVKRKRHHKETLSLNNSEAVYVNSEFEVAESMSEISFDEAYLFQNRVREIELAATESYENLAVTGGTTEYEDMDGKTDSEVEDSQISDRNSIQQEGSSSQKECNIGMDEDGYLLSIEVEAKKPSSERLSTQSEEIQKSNDVVEDLMPASI